MQERVAIARIRPTPIVTATPLRAQRSRPSTRVQSSTTKKSSSVIEEATSEDGNTEESIAADEAESGPALASDTPAPKPRKRRGVLTKKRSTAARAALKNETDETNGMEEGAGIEVAIPKHKESTEDVVEIRPPEEVQVPRLAHGLDRVLFNPGVYYLQDPRSHVYNFDPYLQVITPVKDFNFDALTEYITSSRDPTLDELARKHGLQVVGSTSSMTGVLAQFHYFISNWRPVNLSGLTSVFAKKSKQFTAAQRAPASIYLRHNDGIYAIDADKSLDSGETVLSFLGRSMEKMLTLDPEEFSKLKKVNRADAPTEKSRESYHYSKLGRILMRSQLDCQDARLPGTGTFDLKTRAVLPVRMDVKNAHEGAGYQIFQSTGLLESFEREYYDMIRAAFLKYSLQVRIGKMDGIFVAFHNTERIFGFQYISLEEMDRCIHGSSEQNIAHREYIMSLKQLDRILGMAIEKYPGQSMALHFEAVEDKKTHMRIVIEPLTEEEIKSRQEGELLEALKAAQKNERIKKMPSSSKSTNSKGTLEKMSSTLEQMILRGARGKKKKSQDEEEEKDDHDGASATPAAADSPPPTPGAASGAVEPGVAAKTAARTSTILTLLGNNVVDGVQVQGPPQPSSTAKWQFQFKVLESRDEAEVASTLEAMRARQALAWTDIYDDVAGDSARSPFRADLKRISDLGRKKLERIRGKQTGLPVIFRESSGAGDGSSGGGGGGGPSSRTLEQEYRRNFGSFAA